MKLAYVTTYDASDVHAWSGSGYHIAQALKLSGFHVEYIGNLKERASAVFVGKEQIYGRVLRKGYLRSIEPLILKSYAKQVEGALSRIAIDAVFSPGTIPIAYLRTEHPIVFWTDATFAGMIDFYPSFTNLCRETIKHGHRMEQEALSRCSLAIYSSEWAAKTALENYNIDPQKARVVPYGANIDCDRSPEDIEKIVAGKDFGVCRLLFIGVDWFRKGGDTALETAEILNGKGMQTELHVVGCASPSASPGFVIEHGFVSKKTEEGRRHLNTLFTESHFLIVPSRAECSAVVFSEASSFGLPSLATNVGGIPSAIRNGKNGQTFPLAQDAEGYGEYIMKLMSSREEYQQLAFSSFSEYSDRLNWASAGNRVGALIREFCG